MASGFFNFLARLLTIIVVALVLTGIWVVYDGINDAGVKADCAVVLGAGVKADGEPSPVLRERLDRAVQIYRAHEVPVIIVSGADHVEGSGHSEAPAMAKYLEQHQVPASAIIQDHGGVNTDATAHGVAAIAAAHHFHSVMVVTSYYHITRTKMALRHEGLGNLSQAHSGEVRKEDFFSVAREVADIYYHIYKLYLAPAARQATTTVTEEAQRLSSRVSSATDNMEQSGQREAEKRVREADPSTPPKAAPTPAAQP